MVRESNIITYTPPERVKVEPNIAIVKDPLADNIDGHVIYFCDETARIAKPGVTPTMQLYLPRVGARLRGITAL